jgi:hypothetical protein
MELFAVPLMFLNVLLFFSSLILLNHSKNDAAYNCLSGAIAYRPRPKFGTKAGQFTRTSGA